MVDSIDVDKLKNDAFDAIDALFSDDTEEKTVFDQKETREQENPASSNDFDMLEEFSLALDWEYSEKEINRFLAHLDIIAERNSDKYNLALVKMLKSIVSYLQKAKNKAFPQTLNVMNSVITTLKTVNRADFDMSTIKDEVGAAYQKVVILKQKISEYNEELRKHAIRENVETDLADIDPFAAKEKEDAAERVETIYSYDLIEEEEETPDTDGMFGEPDDDGDLSSYTLDDEPETISPVPGKHADPSIVSRLNTLEERVAYLESQNQQLKKLLIHQPQGIESSEDLFEPGMEDEPASAFDMAAFSEEPSGDSPIDEPRTVDFEDIAYGEPAADMPEPSPDEVFEAGTDYYEEIPLPGDDDSPAVPAFDEKEDFIEYVRFFKLDQQVIAIPNDFISNVYKMPSALKKNISSLDSVPLKDFSSAFQKLSKNMKGSLQDVPNTELKELTADVRLLTTDSVKYNYAVLCSNGDAHVIVPVTGSHKTKLTLATGREKGDNGVSEYSVAVEGMGSIPLVTPF